MYPNFRQGGDIREEGQVQRHGSIQVMCVSLSSSTHLHSLLSAIEHEQVPITMQPHHAPKYSACAAKPVCDDMTARSLARLVFTPVDITFATL